MTKKGFVLKEIMMLYKYVVVLSILFCTAKNVVIIIYGSILHILWNETILLLEYFQIF